MRKRIRMTIVDFEPDAPPKPEPPHHDRRFLVPLLMVGALTGLVIVQAVSYEAPEVVPAAVVTPKPTTTPNPDARPTPYPDVDLKETP